MSRETSGGLSVTTVLIASASAATAAMVVPLFWERGGVLAAAITPIIVTLVSETLRHPVERVTTVGVWRRTPEGTAIRERGQGFDPLDPDAQRVEVEVPEDQFGLREPERPGWLRRSRLGLALVTGAIAFGIAAVVVTTADLAIFGDSPSRPQRTTFFGGEPAKKTEATPTPTATPDEEGATPTPTPSPDATPTPTPAPGDETTPAPTVDPAATPTPATPAPTP